MMKNKSLNKDKLINKKLLSDSSFWQKTFDSVSDGVFILDSNQKITRANKTLLQLIGKKEKDILGCICWDIIHGAESPICDCPVKRMRQSMKRETTIVQVHEKWFEISVDPITNSKEKLEGIIHIVRDITEKKKLENDLYQITQNWEDTFNSITDMVTVHDKNYNIIHYNKAAEKILKLPFLRNNNKKCFKYYHGTEKPPEGCPSCECLITSKPAVFELFEPHLKMYIEIRAIPRFDRENELIGLIHVVRDISERKEFENRLQQLNKQLREFTSHLQKVREDERASLARDIHDEMGQDLTTMKIELSLIESEIKSRIDSKNNTFLLNEIKAMQTIVNNSMKKVREIIRKLHPVILDHLGLKQAIKWLVKEFEKRNNIKAIYKTNIRTINLDKEISVSVFRIVQEALTNISKHSKATKVEVIFEKKKYKYYIEIKDNGIGFRTGTFENKESNGIIGMRERAMISGIEFLIKSVIEKGTNIILTFPVK